MDVNFSETSLNLNQKWGCLIGNQSVPNDFLSMSAVYFYFKNTSDHRGQHEMRLCRVIELPCMESMCFFLKRVCLILHCVGGNTFHPEELWQCTSVLLFQPSRFSRLETPILIASGGNSMKSWADRRARSPTYDFVQDGVAASEEVAKKPG